MDASTVMPGGQPTPPTTEGGGRAGSGVGPIGADRHDAADAGEVADRPDVADRYGRLRERMTEVCRSAVDTDEVAAYLEAGGVNDRIAAHEFGVTSVFSLAARLRAEHAAQPPTPPAAKPPRGVTGAIVLAVLVRAALYMTPAVIALGGAGQFGGLPPAAGTGALIFGWASAQALAFLGYRALGAAGPASAARLLAAGFGAAVVGWTVVMIGCGVTDPRAHAVAVGQLCLFAAIAVALVTGTERRVLVAASGVWLAAGVLAAGAGGWGLWLVGVALAVMLVVAYLPAAGGGAGFRPRPAESGSALVYGTVGAGQALLFASVVLAYNQPGQVLVLSAPLLVGVPLAELVLVWHQRRVAATRAVLTDRGLFHHAVGRASFATLVTMCVPVVVGLLLAAAGVAELASVVLLTAVYGLCLVLAAHQRLGLAATLVWWPAVLIWALHHAVPYIDPRLLDSLVTAILFAVCAPALGVTFTVLRDRWSYP